MAPAATTPEVATGIGAANSKGGDAREAVILPTVGRLIGEVRREAVELNVRVQQLQMKVGEGEPRVDHHDAPGNAADACGGLTMTKVALGAGQEKRNVTIFHGLSQSAHFNRISKSCTRAMAFPVGHRAGSDSCFSHRCLDALLLRGPVRRRQAGAAPILIHIAAYDANEHALRILLLVRIIYPETAASFSSHEAITGFVEGEGPATMRHHACGAIREHNAETVDHATTHHKAIRHPGNGGCLQLVVSGDVQGAMRLAERHQSG
mmetsp:Transcript_4694/g.10404  ORF Transcript_4694/g.10404 Transcript_4694/m.10404 type:complete len:264 (+) Transcript_4694:1237-2028(+)